MPTMADFELAWTSFDKNSKIFKHARNSQESRIHICQKPVALYRWLLQNYAKTGYKIIDTHSGSGSLACACYLEKFDFLAIEKDEDYFKSSVERLDTLRSQGTLF
jgi:site-specific DNA-methyltransferase (adenine-specific)